MMDALEFLLVMAAPAIIIVAYLRAGDAGDEASEFSQSPAPATADQEKSRETTKTLAARYRPRRRAEARAGKNPPRARRYRAKPN